MADKISLDTWESKSYYIRYGIPAPLSSKLYHLCNDYKLPIYIKLGVNNMYSYMRSTITDFSNRLLHLCYELERAQKLETVITYALQYIDKPYIYDNDDPFYGADCSGFLGYIFRAFGAIGQHDDYNCKDYYSKFPKVLHAKAGAVVYYGPKIPQHAMLCMNDLWCIGATGGGPNCTSVQIAELTKARVRIKPIDYRNDIIGYNDPFHNLFA